jgi:hypothetical protein
MKKSIPSLLATLFILSIVFWVFLKMRPQFNIDKNVGLSEFSVKRASNIVKNISQKPHFVGSENHKVVMQYLVAELKNMGLEPEIQQGFTLTEAGSLAFSNNIITKIKGTKSSKALLLLSHYDSASYSKSKGASDDGAGVATILEGIRAFLYNKTQHKNDIIILFSDAEEFGLNGAALFVTQHQWAKAVGLALNFEARGSAGPSFMLMEVNNGNAALIQEFEKADVNYPTSNSLMYSIYKLLPNDTDLTVFRENGQIQGLNFAFIDDHFNYHTQQDDYQHLDPKSLAHNGSYLMPLLQYFSNSDIKDLKSTENFVYFNTPFNFIIYPFSWIWPMSFIALFLFAVLVFVGFGKRILDLRLILRGFYLFILAIIVSGLLAFLVWEIIKIIYPQYNEILQGFPYNGHSYLFAFVMLSLSICFFIYRKRTTDFEAMNHAIAPIFIWILVNITLASYLKGGAFFVIPVFAALCGLGYYTITQKSNKILNLILVIPALIVYVPFIYTIPVGLGLKVLFGSSIFLALVFGLMLPVFTTFYLKRNWAIAMLLLALSFVADAHLNTEFEYGKAKPNSLVYIVDAGSKQANWATYDNLLDEWTKVYFTENSKNKLYKNDGSGKYLSKYTFFTKAPTVNVPKPTITFLKDSINGNFRHLKIKIASNRKVNRYDIATNRKITIYDFNANGVQNINQKKSLYAQSNKTILSYLITDNQPLELEFSIPKNGILDLSLTESSMDLLENSDLNVAPRLSEMMPKPFVMNDAVILKMKIEKPIIMSKPIVVKPRRYLRSLVKVDSIQ